MACCGKAKVRSGGRVVTDKVKTPEGDYYTKYQYLTPQQLANKRAETEVKVWCVGCGEGKPCPSSTYFKCAKRIQLGL